MQIYTQRGKGHWFTVRTITVGVYEERFEKMKFLKISLKR